jgi:hypothetical protein
MILHCALTFRGTIDTMEVQIVGDAPLSAPSATAAVQAPSRTNPTSNGKFSSDYALDDDSVGSPEYIKRTAEGYLKDGHIKNEEGFKLGFQSRFQEEWDRASRLAHSN